MLEQRVDLGDERSATRATLLPLSVRDLNYKVSTKEILDGVNLDVKANGTVAIMGPNGAGKSVLLRMLHGLLTPSSGRILWNGVEVDDTVPQASGFDFSTSGLVAPNGARQYRVCLAPPFGQRLIFPLDTCWSTSACNIFATSPRGASIRRRATTTCNGPRIGAAPRDLVPR